VPDARPQFVCGKGLQLVLVLSVALFAAGCGKKESPKPVTNAPAAPDTTQPATPTATTTPTTTTPTPTAPNANTPPPTPSQPPPPPPPAVAQSSDANLPILQQLNRAMFRFQMANHRSPASVEELAAAAGIQLPPPPPGKKYAINGRKMVVLMDN